MMEDGDDGLRFEQTGDGQARVVLPDDGATLALGARLARALAPGLKIYLGGELGSGKTTLVRGVLRALGHAGRVKSPTFSLVELYRLSRLELYHFDFYRFERPQEWRDAGFRDLFDGSGVCLVEWPERAASALPAPDLAIALAYAGAGRVATLRAGSEPGSRCLDRMIR
jgi:tRNA threonylcarbamoyladenosine biosynthesis protein TsaE